MVNAVQAPKRVMQELTRRESREAQVDGRGPSEQSHRSCRGIGDGMQAEVDQTQHENFIRVVAGLIKPAQPLRSLVSRGFYRYAYFCSSPFG